MLSPKPTNLCTWILIVRSSARDRSTTAKLALTRNCMLTEKHFQLQNLLYRKRHAQGCRRASVRKCFNYCNSLINFQYFYT